MEISLLLESGISLLLVFYTIVYLNYSKNENTYNFHFNYANSLQEPEIKKNLAESRAANVHLSIEDFVSGPNELYGLAEKTWLDNVIAAKLKAESDEALPRRASIIADLEKIKNQVYMSFFLGI